jgi:chaperone modulatory protein CbpM
MDLHAVIALFADLQDVELTTWVDRGWVVPESADTGLVFHEIDVARVRLIHDLRRDLDIGEDAMPVVLSLLDQVYELRGTLKSLLLALQSEPPNVQAQVLSKLVPARRRG